MLENGGVTYEVPESQEKLKLERDKLVVELNQLDPSKPYSKEFMVRGNMVDFLGVEHTTKSLEKYGAEIGKRIQESDVILLEGMPKYNGLSYEEFSKKSDYLKKLSKEDFAKLFESGGIRFYDELADICKQNGKIVATVDPNITFDKALNLEINDQNALKNQIYGLMATFGFMSLDFMVGKFKELKKMREGQNIQKGMTRRDFLKSSLKLVGTVAFGSPLFTRVIDKMNELTNSERGKFEEFFSHDAMDFRNVVIAEGIDRLVKQYPDKKILVIYGAYHQNPVIQYSQDGKSRKNKLEGYNDFKIGTDPTLKIFVPENDNWKEVYSEDIN